MRKFMAVATLLGVSLCLIPNTAEAYPGGKGLGLARFFLGGGGYGGGFGYGQRFNQLRFIPQQRIQYIPVQQQFQQVYQQPVQFQQSFAPGCDQYGQAFNQFNPQFNQGYQSFNQFNQGFNPNLNYLQVPINQGFNQGFGFGGGGNTFIFRGGKFGPKNGPKGIPKK